MKTIRYLVILVLGCLAGADVHPQSVPAVINYQGRLADNTPQQSPVDGIVSMQFEIWDGPLPLGSIRQWREPDCDNCGIDVVVSNGIFSYQLGSGNPIPATLFTNFGANRWLQIIVNPRTTPETLSPRQRLTSNGYAMQAENAATASDAANVGGIPAASVQQVLSVNLCPAGEFFTQISPNGFTACAPDQGVTALNVTQGITGSIAGNTLNLSTDSTVQRRSVLPSCAGGQYLQSISANGTPTCEGDAGASVPLDLSGAPPAPVIRGAHTGGNSGVRGDSAGSHGVYGTTSGGLGFSGVYGIQSGQGAEGKLGTSVLSGVTTLGVGVYGFSAGGWGTYGATASGRGLFGAALSTSGVNYGIYGSSDSTGGFGVYGINSTSGNYGAIGESGIGIRGYATSSAGTGVYGQSFGTGLTVGVRGYSGSVTGIGVYGFTVGAGEGVLGTATTGIGVHGTATIGTGVRGESTSGDGLYGVSASGNGVRAESTGAGSTAILGYSNSSTGMGVSGSTPGGGVGVQGTATTGDGVQGISASGRGVFGQTTGTSGFTYAVQGTATSTSGRGVYGFASATSGATNGVLGETDSPQGAGVRAIGSGINATDQGTALQLESGAIRVVGAGIATSTPVFTHRATSTNTDGSGCSTTITNSLTDSHSNAILIVSQTGSGLGGILEYPIYTSYVSGKWRINNTGCTNGTLLNTAWNILVIYP